MEVIVDPIQIHAFPDTVEGFAALSDDVARVPQGGAAMMVVALLLLAQDEDLGEACLAAAVDPERLRRGDQGVAGWQLRAGDRELIRSQIGSSPHIPRSYVQGAAPGNGYRLPELPYVVRFAYNPHGGDPASGRCKVFVHCSGADSPRPVTVVRDAQGVWRASEWSSLLVGVRAPRDGS